MGASDRLVPTRTWERVPWPAGRSDEDASDPCGGTAPGLPGSTGGSAFPGGRGHARRRANGRTRRRSDQISRAGRPCLDRAVRQPRRTVAAGYGPRHRAGTFRTLIAQRKQLDLGGTGADRCRATGGRDHVWQGRGRLRPNSPADRRAPAYRDDSRQADGARRWPGIGAAPTRADGRRPAAIDARRAFDRNPLRGDGDGTAPTGGPARRLHLDLGRRRRVGCRNAGAHRLSGGSEQPGLHRLRRGHPDTHRGAQADRLSR